MKHRFKHRLTSLSAGLLLAFAAQAQAPGAPQPTAASTPIVLKAAHLFDGRSGRLDSPGLVVVRGDRIVAVGANAEVPAGSRVIDLGDATLLPGYIDAHTHISVDYNENWAQGFYEGMLRFPVEQSFHAGAQRQASRCRPASPPHAKSAPAISSTSHCATPSTPASPKARACSSPGMRSVLPAATATACRRRRIA